MDDQPTGLLGAISVQRIHTEGFAKELADLRVQLVHDVSDKRLEFQACAAPSYAQATARSWRLASTSSLKSQRTCSSPPSCDEQNGPDHVLAVVAEVLRGLTGRSRETNEVPSATQVEVARTRAINSARPPNDSTAESEQSLSGP
jgi:hypothetical protein